MQEAEIIRMQLIDSAKQEILDDVSHLQSDIRRAAISALTSWLDLDSEEGKFIKLTIPLEFIARDDILRAIWYIETEGNKPGGIVSIEVIKSVCRKAIGYIDVCIEFDDEEWKKDIQDAIRSLFHMIMGHPDLMNDPQVFVMMGNYEEAIWNHSASLDFYNKWIEKWDIISYIESARVHGDIWNWEESISILKEWYTLTNDTRLLGPLVHRLCAIHHMVEAMKYYEELNRIEEWKAPPFVVYKWTVENDGELEDIETCIASYIKDANFVPSEALGVVSKSATEYIAEQVYIENKYLMVLNATDIKTWNSEEYTEYARILARRLRLMQIDILSLCNHRFIEYYLRDLDQFWFNWSLWMQQFLEDFFVNNPSEEVLREQSRRYLEAIASDEKDWLNESDDEVEKDNVIVELPQSVFENISIHVSRIWELFFQPSFYDLQKGQIIPILEKSAVHTWEYDDEMEELLSDASRALKDWTDYYYSLNPSIQKNYENLVQELDLKYGVFYRRHIQTLATNPRLPTEQYPESLMEYPDIALLFWMQKLIALQFPTNDPDEIEEIVQSYWLNQVDIINALTFGVLLFDASIEYAMSYIADYPNMLDVPMALYVITEGLRSMDKKSRNASIKDLHAIVKEEYGARGFFDHIRYTFDEIYKNDPSDSDVTDMLLTRGNLTILQNKERTQAILAFHTAWEEFGSLEWLMQAGDSYEDRGEYELALEYFEQALLQDDTIVVLTKILNCTIRSSKFDKAEEYIQYWIAKGYSISNYILALYLWKWATLPAFLQMIQMIKEWNEIDNVPEWLPKLLLNTLEYVMKWPNGMGHEADLLRVYASFIMANISLGSNSIVDIQKWIVHWYYLNSFIDSYQWERLHSSIEDIIGPIIWKLDLRSKEILTQSYQSLAYLDTHGRKLLNTYRKILGDTEDPEKQLLIREQIQELCGNIIITLKKFPESENFLEFWRDTISLLPSIHDTDKTIYDESMTMGHEDQTIYDVNKAIHQIPKTVQ